MSVCSNSVQGLSEDVINASNINADEIVAEELYSLLDAVDSESIADEFRIGVRSDKHDYTNHLEIAVREVSIRPVLLLNSNSNHDLLTSQTGLIRPLPTIKINNLLKIL